MLYLLFFASGASALIYQVVWVRQQSLVFGGSHLAVATVLAVFMAGLALGGALFGRRADAWRRPLRAYGLLEIGVALSALAAYGMLRIFPSLYVPVARPFLDSPAMLTAIRVVFAAAAMIVPTTLMGATLPVLVRCARGSGGFGGRLSFLYAINTLGAVAGAIVAGFLLLPRLGAANALYAAVGLSLAVGAAAWLLGNRRTGAPKAAEAADQAAATMAWGALPARAGRLVLLGIGVSGFCALGYEVLWTRVLGNALGTSTYAFTVMLAAFLAGIGLGSEAFGMFMRKRESRLSPANLLNVFAAVQALIGLAALGVTWLLGDLSAHSAGLQGVLVSAGLDDFAAKQGATFAAAFTYMLIPAFLMGAAFPLAGTINAARRGPVAGAVGEVLAWNTVGAILGALTAGFVLVRLLGIERSLLVLAAINLALAVNVAAALSGSAPLRWAGLAVAILLVALPPALPDAVRLWNRDLIAIYRNNQRSTFDSPDEVRAALANTEILYFHEGANSTISVIRPQGGDQAVLVNGKVVASTMEEDVQCQYLLGHLPMLLHPDPKRVFVLGMGTGMTLGAVSLHPEVERIVLAELEPAVEPAARTFASWNHGVLDDPRLEIAFTDGRNWLLTTEERFEVITADPVHPWTRGSAYLYTAEYYRLAASRLVPGGVMMQWLPLYELSSTDVATVVRTFRTAFPHTQVWLTHYDAHLVGSDRPLGFDQAALEKRLAFAPIHEALARVDMGTPEDFLSFFHFGDAGCEAFARSGLINTDNNLYLEFSAPRSTNVAARLAENVEAIARFREMPAWKTEAVAQTRQRVAAIYDRLHALLFRGQHDQEVFAILHDQLRRLDPTYAPARLLERAVARDQERIPRPVGTTRLALTEAGGRRVTLEITSVTMRTGRGRAALLFVDNGAREIYGETYLAADEAALDARIVAVSSDVLRALETAAAEMGASQGAASLDGAALRARLRAVVAQEIARLSAPAAAAQQRDRP